MNKYDEAFEINGQDRKVSCLLGGAFPIHKPPGASFFPYAEVTELMYGDAGIIDYDKHKVIRPPLDRSKSSVGKLAKISENRINLKRMQKMDPGYLEVMNVLIDPAYFESHLNVDYLDIKTKRRVSRNMLRHLPDMRGSNVVTTDGEKKLFMPIFTVEKKDASLRLIFDCRGLNAIFARPPEMDLPRIRDVIDHIMEHEYGGTSDGVSYFYQFAIHEDIQKYFAARLAGHRGKYVDIVSKVMCMGWSWAPAIGQRVSNVLIRGCGISWVDNFIVLGTSIDDYRTKRKRFLGRVRDVNLELDDYTIQPQSDLYALGIHFDLKQKRYRMDPKWVEKAERKLTPLVNSDELSFKDLYIIAGSLIWRSQVCNVHLCKMPHLLEAMGKVGKKVSETGNWEEKMSWSDNSQLQNEILSELNLLQKNEWVYHKNRMPPTAQIWSDAADQYWCYLIFEKDKLVAAERGMTREEDHIFYSELAAAIRGIARAEERGHNHVLSMVDNQPASMALRRGLSTNFKANRWLGAIATMERTVEWVPSEQMLADPYTRTDPMTGMLIPLPPLGTDINTLKEELGLRNHPARQGRTLDVFQA